MNIVQFLLRVSATDLDTVVEPTHWRPVFASALSLEQLGGAVRGSRSLGSYCFHNLHADNGTSRALQLPLGVMAISLRKHHRSDHGR